MTALGRHEGSGGRGDHLGTGSCTPGSPLPGKNVARARRAGCPLPVLFQGLEDALPQVATDLLDHAVDLHAGERSPALAGEREQAVRAQRARCAGHSGAPGWVTPRGSGTRACG